MSRHPKRAVPHSSQLYRDEWAAFEGSVGAPGPSHLGTWEPTTLHRQVAPSFPNFERIGRDPIRPPFAFPNRYPYLKHLAILLTISLFPTLQAQSPSPHDLAQRIDNRYNHLHSLRAAFTETYNGLGIRRSESGTLTLLKPGRMRWDYSSPAGKIFLLDGKFAWFYARGDAQVQRIPSRDLDDLRSPLRFLLGHTELEKELINLRLTPAPNGQFTLTGQPKGQDNKPDQRVTRLALTITPDGSITAIEIEETDGALTRFTFSGESDNPNIPPTQFHFTPPPGTPIVDATAPV